MAEDVLVLTQDETVRLDPDRLEQLYLRLGDAGADDVVCRAIEELAVRLSHTERLFRQGKAAEMRKSARSLVAISDQIGMRTLARVAGDVTRCIDAGDGVALAAVLSRLIRIGERSLTAIWDTQGLRV
ncbi:hypothetical protein GLS40_00525 [Pseudooceanicola sp. 216_PA32_1]|jgi:hypothetical protein|uniref:Hpt domain-containing protein n=1 Tax=Pseudooceanicola pacificus TaxID=2676438 RepID=A0A844WB83_9RHOB|nr:hypothetical protein [Pseudooceanicola pacificus]MWB76500.1 hypothetical protein [Pseudooceanicola pacificus]